MITTRRCAARRAVLPISATVMLCTWTIAGAAADTGADIFNTFCIGCHRIGGGTLVGPDLQGVTDRRSEEWLVKFIADSQALVESGDPDAVALFEQYKIVMPPTPYSVDEIKDVIAYIMTSGGQGGPSSSLRAATPEDIAVGQRLFEGSTRLANRGPACNSCHHVQNDAVIGGGVLAAELTSVFTRLGAPGVQAILGKPPFPVMEQAYRGKALTDDEVVALVAFLEDADAEQAFQQPRDFGFRLFYSGTGGFVAMMAVYAVVWRRRKTTSVNHRILDRQVRSR